MRDGAVIRVRPRPAIVILAVAAGLALASVDVRLSTPALGQADPGYVVVAVWPHDPEAFTEGLAFRKGKLYEGTGLDDSWLRRVDLETGTVERQRTLAKKYFGEGVTVVGDEVFQITLQEQRGWAYDARTFERLRTFTYEGEGWGLADNGRRLAMSDGTAVIRFRRPRSFEVTREITVMDNGVPVTNLNELEWIGDEIFANVFTADDVVRIDPDSGEVTGRFSISSLHEQEQAQCPGAELANGIAYMQSQDRLFVTGKYWCHIYEIALTDPPAAEPSPSSG